MIRSARAMETKQSVIEQQRLDQARLEANGMYSSQFEKDACGMGFVVNIKGKKSHDIIDDGLRILERLEHRGGAGADKDTGDGAGDRKSTRLNSSHANISYAVFCLKKKKQS